MANPEAIKNKLKHFSKTNNKIHQNTLVKFFQERFLYRLSITEYKDNLLLKGGALAYTFSKEESRHTRDIDFLLTKLKSESNLLKRIFIEISEIDGKDGVIFKNSNIIVEKITKQGKYNGTRIRLEGRLGRISQQLQIDIGIGDHVTPGPQEIIYPVILLELEAPKLLAYSKDTLIAEKFEAMVDLGELNSRMKDFYDIFQFVDDCNPKVLKDAIKNTFKRRKTNKIPNHPIFNIDFYTNPSRVKQWEIFLSKNQLEEIEFQVVGEKIKGKLYPIYREL